MTVLAEIERIARHDHHDPHSILGAHPVPGGVVVRAFRPGAAAVRVAPEGSEPVEMKRIHPAGIYEATLEGAVLPLAYELELDYPDGRRLSLARPVLVLADARRARSAARG